jgi:hypothetical protein
MKWLVIVMFGIKSLFSLNSKAVMQKTKIKQDLFPEGFAVKFEAFKDALLEVGRETNRDRTEYAVSLNNKEAPYNLGTKEWVRVGDLDLAIRYYDVTYGGCESLCALEMNADKECFILQRKTEISTPEEAISVFIGLMAEYADPSFMRALYLKLEESDVLDITQQTTEEMSIMHSDKEENKSINAPITQQKSPPEKTIKPFIV